MDFIKEAVKQNEHWETGVVSFPRLDGRFVERELFDSLRKSVRRKSVMVIRGLRRTGKSVLARELIKGAIKGKKPVFGAWFEFDRAMKATPDNLDSLITFFESKGARTIVLDEIMFVPGWQDVLKRFYDRSEIKFIVTGSSALEMDRGSAESLAGRFELVRVKPFSFSEWLARKGREAPSSDLGLVKREGELEQDCDEYLRTGGLPEAILLPLDERNEYMKNSLLDPLFYKDLPAVSSSANPDMLHKTLELLSASVGSTFQLQSLAQILGCSHPTVALQIELLERALLARVVYNRTPSIMKQKRTAKKIVIEDNGILAALRPDAPKGILAENAVGNRLAETQFWRDPEGREVDFLIPNKKLAIEVKYQEHITTSDERHLRYFLARNDGWKGLVITKNHEEKGDINHVPLWKWMLRRA
ncbi:MAG: ATP-binding protein [Candidatus Micrarchaeota archaeon]